MRNIAFDKSFTQQEPLSRESISAAVKVMRSGRLHRYNTLTHEKSETALLEVEFAEWQGTEFCLATASGGVAMQIALRSVGVKAGDKVLTNSFTLAPVPGAIHSLGAVPVLVDSTEDLVLDLEDLKSKLKMSKARFMLISHMRGHLVDMHALIKILEKDNVVLIEDCAHTMGAKWEDIKSGNFGLVSCFSTQTYKHMNSGEGGFITTKDGGIIASCILLSGSYMLYDKHVSSPNKKYFEEQKFHLPNCSMRMDNLRASILRPQLKIIDKNIERWNKRYTTIASRLSKIKSIYLPKRPNQEKYVGSSLQFLAPDTWLDVDCIKFLDCCKARGVEVKWFGNLDPVGYTSRYESWKYIKTQSIPRIKKISKRLMDIRIPLTFSIKDCRIISKIITEEILAVSALPEEKSG